MHTPNPIRALTLLLALPLTLAAFQPEAASESQEFRPPADPTLGRQIADQGNRALREIQTESVALQLPHL